MQLFGFSIQKTREQEREEQVKNGSSFASPTTDDGAVVVAASGANFSPLIDLDGTVRSDAELVTRYRDLALQPEIEMAIDEIINEMISYDSNEQLVELNTDDLPSGYSAKFKERLREEFKEILRLMDFNDNGYEILRRWYIDGRIYYHVIIDEKNPREGIKELRYIDPRKIRKVKEVLRTMKGQLPVTKVRDEYYVYSERGYVARGPSTDMTWQVGNGQQVGGVKIHIDSIVYGTSGLMDQWNRIVLSHLHKALRPMNQLRSVEDATIIYRLVRAPERRLFYIDVGNLPKHKAEQYVQDLMNRHKNRLVYDTAEGTVRDDRKFMHMMEDYWFPRREGGKGTEVTTLPAGQNLGEMEDVEYFRRILYRSLNVPTSRLIPNESGFNMGRSTEISREEVKFQKFINRLRLRFGAVFKEAFKRQLLLKNIASMEEIDKLMEAMRIDFKHDNYFTELKEAEITQNRVSIAKDMEDLVGKYYSRAWIKKNVLKQTDEEIEEMESEMVDDRAMMQAEAEASMEQESGLPTQMQGAPTPTSPPAFGPDNGEDPEPDPKAKKVAEDLEKAQLDLIHTLTETLKHD
jgi:hypothetical protein